MTKVGELGYVQQEPGQLPALPEPAVSLPSRHPADRDTPQSDQPAPPAADSSQLSTSPPSIRKHPRVLAFFKRDPEPQYAGIHLTTLLKFVAQSLVLLPGTIAAWAISSMSLRRQSSVSAFGGPTSTSAIFVHVAFSLVILTQIIFLERTLFRIRAERYTYKHPGAALPTSLRRNRLQRHDDVAYAPWNRPPLPTYAAALAQSGHATGDVDDHLIAIPPPPAYGNTRGSKMLLTGFLNADMRAQRPVSQHSQTSIMLTVEPSGGGDRPLSYQTVDERWEEVADAERAARLEATLATLQRPQSRR